VQRFVRREEAQLVEVLPADEYEDEHLPDAINIPLKTLDGESTRELDRLRSDVLALVERGVRGRHQRARLSAALEERFATSRFPFRHDRAIPRITVRGTVSGVSLDHGREQRLWTEEEKRSLIARGYALTDAELRAFGVDAIADTGT